MLAICNDEAFKTSKEDRKSVANTVPPLKTAAPFAMAPPNAAIENKDKAEIASFPIGLEPIIIPPWLLIFSNINVNKKASCSTGTACGNRESGAFISSCLLGYFN